MNTFASFKVGNRVRLTRATRHNMVPAGTVGRIVEIRDSGSQYLQGIVVEFLLLPDARIVKIFGRDPNRPEPYRCLFPLSVKRLPFVAV